MKTTGGRRQVSLLLLLLLLLLTDCHGNFIYPDEYEMLKRTSQGEANGLQVMSPTYAPSFDLYVIDPNGRGVKQPKQQIPATLSASPTSSSYSKPTGTLFDTFLPPKWRDHVLNLISRGITKFTLDMDRAIEKTRNPKDNENLVFSPISLTVTLAMILLASGGKTFQETTKILGLESGVDITHHSEIVHQIFGLLLQESDNSNIFNKTGPQCKFAFGVFVENGYPVRQQFKAVSEKLYKSEVINMDFLYRSLEAQSIINEWVRSKTRNKIKDILNSPPEPSTAVIITSALYFNGEWNQHFMQGGTKRKPFTVSPTETIDVDMMYNGGDFPFYQNKQLDLKIVGLPYKGNEVTMYAILPVNASTPLERLKSRLTPEVINGLIDNMRTKPCIIGYPKMKLSSNLRLQSALESLGLRSLFDPSSADLSVLSAGQYQPTFGSTRPRNTRAAAAAAATDAPAIRNSVNRHERRRRQSRPIDQEFVQFLNSAKLPKFGVDELRNSAGLINPHLWADDVVHKVEMTVDEAGTEAAAATSVILNRSIDSMFIADRPFLFFIRHDPTKIIWFWASIKRPTLASA